MTNNKIRLIINLGYLIRQSDKFTIFRLINSSELKINYLFPIWLKI